MKSDVSGSTVSSKGGKEFYEMDESPAHVEISGEWRQDTTNSSNDSDSRYHAMRSRDVVIEDD